MNSRQVTPRNLNRCQLALSEETLSNGDYYNQPSTSTANANGYYNEAALNKNDSVQYQNEEEIQKETCLWAPHSHSFHTRCHQPSQFICHLSPVSCIITPSHLTHFVNFRSLLFSQSLFPSVPLNSSRVFFHVLFRSGAVSDVNTRTNKEIQIYESSKSFPFPLQTDCRFVPRAVFFLFTRHTTSQLLTIFHAIRRDVGASGVTIMDVWALPARSSIMTRAYLIERVSSSEEEWLRGN